MPSPLRVLRPLAVLLVATALVVSACSSGGSTSASTTSSTAVAPRTGGVLDIAVPADPIRWSPLAVDPTTAELQAQRAVYDRLMALDANGVAVPDLADSVTSNPEFTVWTIRLRSGVTFSDGTVLDASSVAAALLWQRSTPAAYSLLAPVQSIEVIAPHSVRVTMTSPWSTFPSVLATPVGAIASVATMNGTSPTPIGTGPFVWSAVGADGTVTLVRNATYWRRGLPRLDAVRLIPIAQANDRLDALLDGRVSMVAVDESAQLVRLSNLGDAGSRITVHDDRNAERPKLVIALDTGRPPFDRESARRAVLAATDRSEILTKVFDGQGAIARGPISDPSPWFTDHAPPARDLTVARRFADEYTKATGAPLSFHLLVPPDVEITLAAAVWRSQLLAAGIDVTLDPVDGSAESLATVTGQYQAAMMVGFSSLTPDSYLPLFAGSVAEQSVLSANITRYVDPTVIRALNDARTTTDVSRQLADYGIMQEQVALDVPYLFLVQMRQVVATSSKVRDLTSWQTGSGSSGLGQDAATVSLAQVWIAP